MDIHSAPVARGRRPVRLLAVVAAALMSTVEGGANGGVTSPPQVEAAAQDAADAGSAAHQSRFITHEGRRIHYLDWGTPAPQPFIMLHGFGRSAHRFDGAVGAREANQGPQPLRAGRE